MNKIEGQTINKADSPMPSTTKPQTPNSEAQNSDAISNDPMEKLSTAGEKNEAEPQQQQDTSSSTVKNKTNPGKNKGSRKKNHISDKESPQGRGKAESTKSTLPPAAPKEKFQIDVTKTGGDYTLQIRRVLSDSDNPKPLTIHGYDGNQIVEFMKKFPPQEEDDSAPLPAQTGEAKTIEPEIKSNTTMLEHITVHQLSQHKKVDKALNLKAGNPFSITAELNFPNHYIEGSIAHLYDIEFHILTKDTNQHKLEKKNVDFLNSAHLSIKNDFDALSKGSYYLQVDCVLPLDGRIERQKYDLEVTA